MNIVDDVTRAVREAVAGEEEDVQIVLNGYLVVETLDVDATTPTLRHYRIGDATPWALSGMLRAAVRATDAAIDAGHVDGDE